MERIKPEKTYLIDDADLVEALARSCKVVHVGGSWYTVTPALSDDITWLDSVTPVVYYGTSLVNLCSTTGVYMRLDFYKNLNKTSDRVACIEKMRKDTWYVLNCFGIGSDVYNKVMAHFRVMTEIIQECGYRPANLSETFDTINVKVDRLIAQKYEHLNEHDRLSETALQELQEAWSGLEWGKAAIAPTPQIDAALAQYTMRQMQNAVDRMREGRDSMRNYENIDVVNHPHASNDITPIDPAQELLDKAKAYSNEGDPETAAHNLLNVYNNLRYQEFWGAASTVKAQIAELGYEVVDGFDDSDPAQVVKKV